MSAKILIIDDEPSARLTLENLLFAEGYTLQFAKNGTDGLAQAFSWQPDVILSDVMMPGIDGFEFCRRIRTDANMGQVPIILITALNDRKAKLNGLQAGADDFITKPIDSFELRARLRTLTQLDRFRKLSEERLKLEDAHLALIQAHEALRTSETRFRNLVETSSDAIFIVEQITGKFVSVNPSATQIYGYTSAEFLQMQIADVFAEPEQTLEALRQNLAPVPEGLHRRKDGTLFPVEIISGFFVEQGKKMYTAFIRDISVRKHMQTVLEVEAVRRRILFDEAPDGILIIDTQTTGFLEFNTAAHTQLGYTREEFAQLHIFDIEAQETAEETRRRISEVFEKGKVDFETLQRTKQGELRNIYVTAQIVKIMDQPVYYCTWRDVTERRQIEEARRESDERYHLLFETMLQGVVFQDREGRIVQANSAAERILGLTFDQLQDRTSVDPRWLSIHEDGSPFSGETHPAMVALKTGQVVHNAVMGVINPIANTYRWININAVPRFLEGEPQPYQVYTTFEDITERKQFEKALRENEERYRALIENAPDGIVLIDSKGKFLYASPSVERIFGYTQADLPFLDSLTMTHPDDQSRILSELSILMADPSYIPTLQYRFHHKNGAWRWIESTFSNLLALPSVEAIIINFRDIHERKVAEEALNKSQALLTEAQRIGRIGYMEWTGNELAMICSAEVYDILELPQDAVITQDTLAGMMTPEERARIQALDFQAIHQRRDMDYEYLIQLPGGRKRWLHQMSRVTYDENGFPTRMMAIVQDVSTRKQTEDTLRESRSRIEMALNGASAGMWDWNVKTGETIFNERWAEIVGYTLEELAPISIQTWFDLCHPEDLAISNALLEQHFARETEFYECEARMKHKNGMWVWVVDRGKVMEWDAAGKPVRMFGTHLDITERKREERYLEARLRLENLSYDVKDMETLMRFTLDEAEALTESEIGFYHFVDDDQNTIKLQAWSTNTLNTLCTAEGKGQHYPIAQAGVWADGIRDGEPRIYNDYQNLPNRGTLPDGHAEVRRLISLPIKRNNLIVAAIGVGNKQRPYNERDLEILKRLAEDAFDIVLRKRAEQALRSSEEKYRGLMQSLSNAISIVDLSGRFVYMNDMAAERLNRSPQELIGKDMHELFPSAIAAYQLGAIQHVFQTDQEAVFEAQSNSKDGIRWYRFSLQPLHDESGKVVQVLINATDIHALKTTQQQLMELNRTLEARVQEGTAEVQDLYDNAPTGYHSLDAEGRYVAINQTELNWLKYTQEEVLGHSFAEFVTEPGAQLFQNTFLALTENSKVTDLEFEMKRKDGSTFPVLINAVAILDEQGNYLRSRSTMFDNTERKKVETALRDSEATYRALFENSNDGIFLMSSTGEELRANQRALDMLGYTLEEYLTLGHINQNPFTFDHDQREDADQKLAAILRGEHVPLYERIFTSKDHRKIPVEINLSPVRDETGKIFMVQSVVRDISQRKQAEEAMRNANLEMERALRLKDEFLANMSHELRTPLNSILGMAESLLEEIRGPLNERQKKMLSIIEVSGRHLLSLINDILDLSKIEAGKLEVHIEPISVADVCQASLAFIKQPALKKGLTMEYLPDARVTTVRADMRRLKQILVNLLNNAVKFTSAPGKITLSIQANEHERMVEISVKDTGIGIAQNDLSRLFHPFIQIDSSLTRQFEGTGLGLALVRELTELHGGRVRVTSDVGVGSTFTVFLPWHEEAPARNVADIPSEKTDIPELINFSHKPPARVLLADDVKLNSIALGDYLENLGYEIVYAVNGLEALEKAAEFLPNIILMDVQMPEMDGLTAIRRLRAEPQFAATPIIALTAMAMRGDRERCLESGATDYISKPVSLKQIAELLQKYLGEPEEK